MNGASGHRAWRWVTIRNIETSRLSHFLDIDLATILLLKHKTMTALSEKFFNFSTILLSRCHAVKTPPVKTRPVTVQLNMAASQTREQTFELSLNLKQFVTLSEMSSTTLSDLPGNTDEVHAYIYRYYPMPHEIFRGFGVEFEALSQTYVSGTPIYHPRLLSRNWFSWLDLLVLFFRHSE